MTRHSGSNVLHHNPGAEGLAQANLGNDLLDKKEVQYGEIREALEHFRMALYLVDSSDNHYNGSRFGQVGQAKGCPPGI